MFSRYRISLVLALILSLTLTMPVFAGGWAVITVDELPNGVVAGQPYKIGFTVLQHGITPMTGIYPTIRANLHKDTEFIVNAEPEGKPGHYVATLTFPKEGEWRWFINAFTMDQLMPMLTVSAPSGASVVKPEPVAPSVPWVWIIRGLAMGGVLVGMTLTLRRRTHWSVALTVVCLGIGGASFMTGAAVPAVEAQSASASKMSSETSISQAELGGQLFIAKGCITCHRNSKAPGASDHWTIDMGAPDLSKFSANAEVIAMRLKDPTSVKSDTKMPNLGLKQAEIDALVAFINSR